MTAPEPAPRKRGKIGAFVDTVFGWPARLSVPARVAWMAAICLLLAILFVWISFLLDPRNVPWRHSLSPWRVALILLLLLAIPFVIYRGLRLWLQGDEHEFPDIDFDFTAGLQALAEHGLTIDSTPLFLFVGSEGDQQERAVLAAAGRSLSVRAVPSGPAALHWYAYPNAIYLFCSSSSLLSAIARLVDVKRASAGALPAMRFDISDALSEPATPVSAAPAAAPPPHIRAAAPPVAPPPAPLPESQSVRGTISVDQFLAGRAAESPVVAPAPAHSPALQESQSPRGTLVMSTPVTTAPAKRVPGLAAQASAVDEGASAAVLTAQEAAEQRRRFEHVCSLVVRAREPVCPVNGIVALIPYEAVQANPREADALQRALHGDLETALGRLRLRCPVTLLFTGLDRERGFSELVRRVGQQRALTQRFGRGFDVAALATKEELAAFALHVCGAFEDWIYTLFREQGALTRPGNTHLFDLLCRVRFNLKSRLTDLLAEGLGFDGEASSEDRLLVSGCYFAATGPTPDRQAFVKSVFDKLEEEQEAVEWSQRAEREFRFLKWFARIGWGLAGALLILAAVLLIRRFTGTN
jgi:hypothetical protein